MRTNESVAALLEEYADRLAATGDEYRPRSYRRAAENIRAHPVDVGELDAEGLREIEGVGDSIAEKTREFVETGSIDALEEAREELPVDMDALTSVEGVGPKTVGDLYRGLGITTLDELEAAARSGRIRELDGYGERTEANILENVAFARQAGERALLGDARPVGEILVDYLGGSDPVERCALAGSLRRWRATIGDVDALAAGSDHEAIVDHFLDWPAASAVIESGPSKASVRADGTRVDLRVVDPGEWGSALQYFTGSRDHNIRLRNRAIERDYTVNEYGVFDVEERSSPARRAPPDDVAGSADPDVDQRVGEQVAGETEEGVYAALDLPWIAPELREDGGEIAAAAAGTLPDLVDVDDVRGDLHVHTEWSDGAESIEGMAESAAAFGHEYLCVADHASGPGVVGGMGLSDAEIRDQLNAVREVDDGADIEVFAGIETNIGADGEVSAGDVLADLDLVVASPHSGLDGDGTDRLVAAIEHPHVDVIGHPSGRLLNERPGLEVDVDAVAAAAADHDTALEINANPSRLDLWSDAVRRAVDAGAPIAVNTDAHSVSEYGNLRYGVHTARRGWAEAGDVINARGADGLRAFL